VKCAVDNYTGGRRASKRTRPHTEKFGQGAFTIDAKHGAASASPNSMVYHTSSNVRLNELAGRAEWTMDSVVSRDSISYFCPGGVRRQTSAAQRRPESRIPSRIGTQRTTGEIQQAIPLQSFSLLQASARAEDAGGRRTERCSRDVPTSGHYFWDTEIYVVPFLAYTSPHIAKKLLTFRYKMLQAGRARARQTRPSRGVFPGADSGEDGIGILCRRGHAQLSHQSRHHVHALRKYVQATGDEQFLA